MRGIWRRDDLCCELWALEYPDFIWLPRQVDARSRIRFMEPLIEESHSEVSVVDWEANRAVFDSHLNDVSNSRDNLSEWNPCVCRAIELLSIAKSVPSLIFWVEALNSNPRPHVLAWMNLESVGRMAKGFSCHVRSCPLLWEPSLLGRSIVTGKHCVRRDDLIKSVWKLRLDLLRLVHDWLVRAPMHRRFIIASMHGCRSTHCLPSL